MNTGRAVAALTVLLTGSILPDFVVVPCAGSWVVSYHHGELLELDNGVYTVCKG